MKRLVSRLVGLLALCSLLALGGITAAWTNSYQSYDRGHMLVAGELFAFASGAGEVGLSWNSNDTPPEPVWFRRMNLVDSGFSTGIARTLDHNANGFGISQGSISMRRGGAPVMYRRVAFPYWLPAGMLGVLPLAWMWHESRKHLWHKRTMAQLCRKCAFDISNIIGFCPECGEPTPPPAKSPEQPEAYPLAPPDDAPSRRAA